MDEELRRPGASGARVLATDGRANVHVISLGAEDGVKLGSTYGVSRGSEYIGTLKITHVQAKQAAGSSVAELPRGDIRRGDRVGREGYGTFFHPK